MLKEHVVVNFFKILKIEYSKVVKFLSKEGQSPAEIKKRLDNVYGDSASSHAPVKNWVKEFWLGRKSVEDVQNEGRSVEVFTPERIKLIEQEVLIDRRLKIKKIAERLDLFKSTVHRALHDHVHIKN
jgi:hypothetical protein